MRHGPVGNDFFYFNGNGLGLKHADDNGQAAVAPLLPQHQRKRARLRLALRKPQDFKFNLIHKKERSKALHLLKGKEKRSTWTLSLLLSAGEQYQRHLPQFRNQLL